MTKFKIYLYIALSGLIMFAYYLWQFTSSYSDFGLNFFTEIIGIAITLFVVEKFLVRIKENENLPLQIAVYNEINRFTSAQIRFFQDLYQKSITDPEPNKLEDLLSQEIANKIWMAVDMNATPLVHPKIDMWTFIQREIKSFTDKGNEILNRYSGHIDPKVHLLLHDLTNSILLTTLQSTLTIRQYDIQNKIPRPTVLTAYSIEPPKKYFEDLLSLHNWLVDFHKKYGKITNIAEPFKYVHLKSRDKYLYKKDEIILKREMENYEAFQKKPSS